MRTLTVSLLLFLALATSTRAWVGEFITPRNFTANDTPAAKRQMSRNPHGTVQDKYGLSLVYWSGGDVTRPSTPSTVWHRRLLPPLSMADVSSGSSGLIPGFWSKTTQLDQSLTPDGQMLGGRQPSLAIRPNGSLFVTWHDHRNSTATMGWINNVEIYGDRRGPFSTDPFSTTDLRLSNSNAGTAGDNSYLPYTIALPDGRLAVVWYDYHWNPNGPSDLCLRLSDTAGNFDPFPSMDSVRITTPADRLAEDTTPIVKDFTVPSMAVDSSNTLHIAWQAGNPSQLTGTFDLYYGRYDLATSTWLEKMQIRNAAGHFLDPAKVIVGPDGAIYLLYSDFGSGTTRNILLQRRLPGATQFEPPRTLATFTITDPTLAKSYVAAPDMVVAPDGQLHVVYAGRRADQSITLQYMLYDYALASPRIEKDLTAGLTGNWTRPAITFHEDGFLIVFEENRSFDTGDLWFTTNFLWTAATDWQLYQ